MEKFDYNEDQIEALIIAIYSGYITLYKLPKELYKATYKSLSKAVESGYSIEFGKPDLQLLSQLKNNIYFFSGAKTATQIMDMKSLLIKDGEAVSLAEFKKTARAKFDLYNQTHLETEYITAHTAASSAANFQFTMENKDIFPYLTSVAIIDKYTAEECLRMNGVTAKVDSPIWNHNLAPRHWKCRCHEERSDKYDKVNLTSEKDLKEIEGLNNAEMQDVFKNNPAKTGEIFDRSHNYFDIGRKYPALGKNNFNLPIP